MKIDLTLPLDGPFLRRQCPSCQRQFKWHHGPTDDRPNDAEDPPTYHCPYCGEPAETGSWWTDEQVEYAREIATAQTALALNQEFAQFSRHHRRGPFRVSVRPSAQALPAAPVEPADMAIVAPPCHPWEPFKVLDQWAEPLHCLVCGRRFALF